MRKNKSINSLIIIASTGFPYGSASANLVRNLSLGLTNIGCKIHLLISRGGNSVEGEGATTTTNDYKGVKYTYCSFKKKPHNYLLKIIDVFIGVPVALAAIIKKKFEGNIDAVIIYTGFAYQNFPVVLTCKLLNIPVFKYSVDYYNKNSVARKWWLLPKWWLFKVEINFFDKFLDGIIAISKMLQEHYLQIGIPNEKLLVIPNILDLHNFETDWGKIKKNNNIRIGYAGAAPLLNGVDDLIRAFSIVKNKHTNTELLIVGDVVGEDSQLPLLKKIAREHEVLEFIDFKGRVPGQEVPGFLASCDILVLARKNTQYAQAGFPTKLGEYFATEKPVIMTDVGDITSYFTDGEELMIAEADNPDSVAEKIIYLIDHIDESKKIAKSGRNWAVENLDYINNSKKILEFMLKHV